MPDLADTSATASAVGRLRFERPEGAVWRRSGLSRHGTDVVAEPWDGVQLGGSDRQTAVDAAGAALQAEVFRRSPPWRLEETGVTTAYLGGREAALADGRRAVAVLGYPGAYSLDGERRWDVVADGGAALLTSHRASQRPEDDVLAELLDLLSASRSAGDAGFGDADWLYGGPVALALSPASGAPGRSEAASVAYSAPTGTLSLRIAPSAGKVNERSLLERWRDVLGAVAQGDADGAEVETVRSGTRVVAGLGGEELVEVTRAPGGAERRTMTWEHRGPETDVTIGMEPSTGPLDPALAAWDRLLDSVHQP